MLQIMTCNTLSLKGTLVQTLSPGPLPNVLGIGVHVHEACHYARTLCSPPQLIRPHPLAPSSAKWLNFEPGDLAAVP